MSCHQLHAIQTSSTFVHTISREPGPQPNQNVHNQAKGCSRLQGTLGREGAVTRRLKVRIH